jgi:hypothetical protein
MEACYGGTDVMERSCAVARGIDINKNRPKPATWLGWAYLTKDQRSTTAATMPIATAFKFYIRHRKNGRLNRLTDNKS